MPRLSGVRTCRRISHNLFTKRMLLCSVHTATNLCRWQEMLKPTHWHGSVGWKMTWLPVSEWMHKKLKHARQKAMWESMKAWSLPLSYEEVLDVCSDCVLCKQKHPQLLPRVMSSHVKRGQMPLTHWQIDYTGPFPLLESCRSALMCTDTATGLLKHCLAKRLHNRPPSEDCRSSVVCMEHPQILRVTEGRTLWGPCSGTGQQSSCHLALSPARGQHH